MKAAGSHLEQVLSLVVGFYVDRDFFKVHQVHAHFYLGFSFFLRFLKRGVHFEPKVLSPKAGSWTHLLGVEEEVGEQVAAKYPRILANWPSKHISSSSRVVHAEAERS